MKTKKVRVVYTTIVWQKYNSCIYNCCKIATWLCIYNCGNIITNEGEKQYYKNTIYSCGKTTI